MKQGYILLMVAIALPALGQVQTPEGTEGPVGTRLAKQIQQRFSAADRDGDGHLTLAEAQAGMPRLAKRFATIDTDNKGYITFDELRMYYAEKRQTQANPAI